MPKTTKIVENVSGVVRSFANGKGEITFEQFGDVPVDHSAIVFPVNRNGDNYLRPKQNVICTIMCGSKGMFAVNVRVVFKKKPAQDTEDEKGRSVTGSLTSSVDGIGAQPLTELAIIEKDLRGEVTEFDPTRRSGFVAIRQYGKLPCYADHIIFSGLTTTEDCLESSQIVRCDVGRGKRGILFAINIHVICDAPSTDAGGKDKTKKPSKEASTEGAVAKSEAQQPKKTLEIIASDQLGEVISYNPSAGNGHIQVQGYDKLPVKKADVVGSKCLMPQQIVRVDVARGPKANITSNVRIIADVPKKKNAQVSQLSDETSKNQDLVAKDQLGEIVSFNTTHRNGHVKVQGFGNLIVNRSAVGDIETLKPQQIVKCDVMRGPKSNFASNIRLIPLIGTKGKEKVKQPQNPPEKVKQPQNPPEKAKQPQNAPENDKQPQNAPLNIDKLPGAPPPPPMNPQFQHPLNQGQSNYFQGQQYPFPTNPGVAHPNYFPTHPMNPLYPYPPNPNVDQSTYFSPPPMPHGFPGHQDMPPPYQSSRQMPPPPPPPQSVDTAPEITIEKSSKKVKSKKKAENELANAVEKLKLICEICKDRLEDPVTIPCEHLFCRECLNEWLAVNPSCPVDGKAVSKKAVKAAPMKIRELASVFGELKVK